MAEGWRRGQCDRGWPGTDAHFTFRPRPQYPNVRARRMPTSPSRTALTLLGVLLSGVVLIAFQALVHPRIADPDAFYHLGHALLYRAEGPGYGAFPWTAFSVIGAIGADLWYGLHLLVTPFAGEAVTGDGIPAAIRVASVALSVLGVAAVARIAAVHSWVAAPIWPVLFLIAVPNVLFRYLSLRPEAISIPLALLLLSGWVRGRAGVVALAAFGMAWVHLSMFWLIIGVGMTGVIGRAAARDFHGREELRSGLALVAGLTAGTLARPNPVGALELAWVQIAELLFEKTGGVPLTFSDELSPIGIGAVLAMAWPALLAWAAALLWVLVRTPRVSSDGPVAEADTDDGSMGATDRALFVASAILAVGFLLLTFLVARRSLVYWAAFSIPGIAIAATSLARTPERRRVTERVLVLAALPLFAWGLHRNDLNAQFVALAPDRLAAEAEWLQGASEPDDLVFNTHWDAFGPLFVRNRSNRYLGGMDPIFQFAADERRYWLFHHISTGVATAVTCPAADCTPADVVDVWEAIRGEYGARWVLTERTRDALLIEYLDSDGRFRRAFEGRDGVVFEVAVSVARPGAEGP